MLRNKTDAADARAIWTAAQQPDAHFVAVKSETQQAILALHRLRAQLLKFRIMQTNALRGLQYKFGEVLPAGHAALAKALPAKPGPSSPAASSQPGSAWYRDSAAPAAGFGNWASPSEGTSICAPCSCMARGW